MVGGVFEFSFIRLKPQTAQSVWVFMATTNRLIDIKMKIDMLNIRSIYSVIYGLFAVALCGVYWSSIRLLCVQPRSELELPCVEKELRLPHFDTRIKKNKNSMSVCYSVFTNPCDWGSHCANCIDYRASSTILTGRPTPNKLSDLRMTNPHPISISCMWWLFKT